ncbi:ABC transporter ATP-binding protein [Aquabacter sp. CN5-332]|uniref:ABC transporter ATP-binding protein n=1 Tax=Aquabacter sp. CN5-332 TaxID=3156608 RepID=UPI0032B4CFFF
MASQRANLKLAPAPLAHGGADARPLAVDVRDLRKAFSGRTVLKDVNLAIHQGEFVALVGRSGCGKSTLLRILSGLEADVTGSVTSDPSFSYVFQDARLVPWRRVWENITLGDKGSKADRRTRAKAALEEVGLSARLDDFPVTLSGGEAQRVAFARAILNEPKVLLLDEPFGALDALTRMQMQALLMALHRRHGFTALFVTHDVEEAILLADRILVMAEGRIASAHDVSLPRPRQRTNPKLLPLRRGLLSELGVPDE